MKVKISVFFCLSRGALGGTRKKFFCVVIFAFAGLCMVFLALVHIVRNHRRQHIGGKVIVAAALSENRLFETSTHQVQVVSKLPTLHATHSDNREIKVNTSVPVVNRHPFRYIINCPDLCRTEEPNVEEVFLLIYVHTAFRHFRRRSRIRETWGRESNYPDVRVKTVFVLGRRPNTQIQTELEIEAATYGDIVEENFDDTYRNLTYKAVAALQWIATYCNRTSYVIKADDDVFINMFTIVKHLKDLHWNNYRTRLLMCSVVWHGSVYRRGKWGVPEITIPNRYYPTYCLGMFFLMSADVARALYRVSFHVPFFWVDDVYITGQLVQALGGAVKHVGIEDVRCNPEEMTVLYGHETEWYKYAVSNVHDDGVYWAAWSKLMEMTQTRKIPTPTVIRPGVLADKYLPLIQLFPITPRLKRRKKKGLPLPKRWMRPTQPSVSNSRRNGTRK